MKNTDNFRYQRKPACATAKSTLFAVSKDEWDVKEDNGKSMKNALYVLRYAKSTLFTVSKDEWDTKEDTGKSMRNALYVLWYANGHLSGRSDIKQ